MQSLYWSQTQCTLFISIISWLEVDQWDDEESRLDIGDEVTVNGAKSGEGIAEGSYWGRITGVGEGAADGGGGDTYEVEDKDGDKALVARSVLRHRSLYRQAFVGVTGDRTHDSYSMRHFSEAEWEWLEEKDIFADQKISVIATHSDNAGTV